MRPPRPVHAVLLLLATGFSSPVRGEGARGPAAKPCVAAKSIGSPFRGRLECGRPLESRGRLAAMTLMAFGTELTVDALHRTAGILEKVDPRGPALEVWDLSGPSGGRIPFHLSHQTGRDADLSYFYREGLRPESIDVEAPLEDFDARRSWLLLEALIATGQVEMLLVDYEVQKLLWPHAKARGFEQLFQYPRAIGMRAGLIRHWTNHRSHVHVRFRCPPGDRACRG